MEMRNPGQIFMKICVIQSRYPDLNLLKALNFNGWKSIMWLLENEDTSAFLLKDTVPAKERVRQEL